MPEPANWDDMSRTQRVRHLEKRFVAAVAALEAGPQRNEDVLIAQAALTSMRAELYGTRAGRARYRQYESRFDSAIGESP